MENSEPVTFNRFFQFQCALLGLMAATAFAHPTDFNEIVSRAGPAVVNINAISTTEAQPLPDDETHRNLPEFFDRFFGEDQGPPMLNAVSSGSGFIVDADGLVVTNRHVILGAREIRIRLSDRREFMAEVIGTDPATDIALLKIAGEELPVVEVGHTDDLEVGDWVVAIGSPFNFENSVTAGIVSAKGRSFAQQQYVPFLQTDTPINRGNSGGPLLDMKGRVVGVNSQIFSENGTYMGLSFSIPIEIAMAIVEQLRDNGEVRRGLLGVSIEDVTRDLALSLGLAEPRGAAITFVTEGSAAEKAGLRPWDVILELDGQPIRRFSDLPPRIGLIEPGDSARLTVFRDGHKVDVPVVIGSFDNDEQPAADDSEAADAADDDGIPERLGLELEVSEEGLVVVDIDHPAAWRAGLQRGDVIQSVNRHPVESIEEFDRRLRQAEDAPVALLVRSGQLRRFVVIPRP